MRPTAAALAVSACALCAMTGHSRTAEFGPTVEDAGKPPSPAPDGMAWIPGGEFSMGAGTSDDGPDVAMGSLSDARPVHRVRVDGFWMDRTEVTNEQFERFVRETGWVTVAERPPRAEDVPGARAEDLVAGSVLFAPPASAVPLDSHLRWWRFAAGASWRHPEGPGSDLRGRERHPVVHVAYEDAAAYAAWAGKRLPTEAEFEFAARGGLAGRRFPWGDEPAPGGHWQANAFQGSFPDRDDGADGFRGIAPVASFPPNRYGLHDMAGNVWEWVGDWYRPDYYATLARAGVARNPTGPASSFDPAEPGVQKRVHRGGSFLCSRGFCTRYLVGSRGRGDVSTGTNHLGFRCVRAGR